MSKITLVWIVLIPGIPALPQQQPNQCAECDSLAYRHPRPEAYKEITP
jgi:hypothetical protein